MTRSATITTVLVLLLNCAAAQSTTVVDSLLFNIYSLHNSKNIASSQPAKKIIALGNKVLPVLAAHFTDTTQTRIKSDCQDIYLTKGEVAIILADRIELMPYAKLTGIQNCLVEFCEDNGNLIEYYMYAIRRNNAKTFQQHYIAWLNSSDRKKWPPYLNNKKE